MSQPGATGELPTDPDVVAGVPRLHRHAWETLRERWDILLVISLGGALGSLARWALSAAMPHRPGQFAWGTLTENLTGALVLGLVMVLVVDVWPSTRYVRPFFGVGVLGGYTTFSTYMLDTHGLLRAGDPGLAVLYLLGTLGGGLIAVWVGILAARAATAASLTLAHLVRRRRARRTAATRRQR